MLASCDVALPARGQSLKATSLFDLFLDSHRSYGDRPALCVEGSVFTYARLYKAAARLAGAVQMARGPGDPRVPRQCGLLVNRTPTAYEGVLASLMVGSAYVPLNPRFPCDRLRDALVSSAVDTLIIDHRSVAAAGPLLESISRPLTVLLPDAAELERPLPASRHQYLFRGDIERALPAVPISDCSSEDGAYLLFTSGSTGKPKGVLISNGNALAYVENARRRYRPGPTDRFSQLFDFSFDLSVHDMFLAWSSGACVYCAPEAKLVGLSDFIRRCQLTFWFSVPSTAAFMRQLRMLKPGSYPSLRWSLFCGEALPMGLAAAWQDAAPNSTVENLYGPTEATVAFTAYRLPKERRPELNALPTVPIGMPLSGQKVMVANDRGEPLPEGQAGELFLGGSQVAAGYWYAPDQTAERFQSPRRVNGEGTRWYRTGDRVIMSGEHGLVFLGRIDRQTKIRGHRVELMEVENTMRVAAATDTVAAIPWPVGDDGLALGLVGFVAGSQKTPAEITDACRNSLPDYMVPGQIHGITSWPLNGNGKTDYFSLTRLLHNDDVKLR